MGKKRSSCDAAAHRAWRLLHLAQLWARKGGLMKCRLMAELCHGAKYLKGLNNKHWAGSLAMDMIRYGERQLSFDDTPVIHLWMSRPASLRFMIPCIKPEVVDFNYDFGDNDDHDDVGWGSYGGRRSLLGCKAGDHILGEERENEECEEQGMMENEDEGIDVEAEEFIANFYQQIKLQREISFQRRYNNAIQML